MFKNIPIAKYACTCHTSEYWTNNFVRVYYFVTLLMYTREYLIALFFPAQRPYWFVSVLSHNPIPFSYSYFSNSIPFPPKHIKMEVEMRFFCPFPSIFIAMCDHNLSGEQHNNSGGSGRKNHTGFTRQRHWWRAAKGYLAILLLSSPIVTHGNLAAGAAFS